MLSWLDVGAEEFLASEWCWQHKRTQIKVWADAIDLSLGRPCRVVFHYTDDLAFRRVITSAPADAWASLVQSGGSQGGKARLHDVGDRFLWRSSHFLGDEAYEASFSAFGQVSIPCPRRRMSGRSRDTVNLAGTEQLRAETAQKMGRHRLQIVHFEVKGPRRAIGEQLQAARRA